MSNFVATVADAVPSLMAYVDAELRYRFNNRAYEAWFGRPLTQITGRTMAEVLGESVWRSIEAHIRRAMNGETVVYESQLRYPSQSPRWVQASYTPDIDESGKAQGFSVLVTDITDRRHAEHALAEKENLLQMGQRAARMGNWTLDIATSRMEWSDALFELCGLRRSSLEPTMAAFLALVPEPDRNLLRQATEAATVSGRPFALDHRIAREDGDIIHVSETAEVRRDSAGAPALLAATMVDITPRQQAEKALAESEQRYRYMFESAGVAILEADYTDTMSLVSVLPVAGSIALRRYCEVHPHVVTDALERVRIVDANREAVRMLNGIEKSDLSGSFSRLATPDMHASFAEELAAMAGNARSYSAERALRTLDGRRIQVLFNAAYPGEGAPDRVLISIVNITERKHAEEALAESERRFRRMADSAPVLIWMSGLDKQCNWFNRAWLEFTGRPLELELGMGWSENVHPADYERCVQTYLKTFDNRTSFTMEYRLRRHDGEYRWMLDSGTPLTDENGVITGYIGSCIDITGQKRVQEALQETDRRKDEFLATLAHELRNPLAPLQNALHILGLAGEDRGTFHRMRGVMERQVHQLVHLVDDLLDVSRISRGVVELRKEYVLLSTILDNAIETSMPLIDKAYHDLQIALPAEPIMLEADPTRLSQVFSNLLNNAAKYTPARGRITLGARRTGDRVVVTVKDSGIGIPREMLPRVFDMFRQVNHELTHTHGGLGVGLTLARNMVERHGGTMEAHSAGPGQGAEFIVRLPVSEIEQEIPVPDPGAQTRNRHAASRRVVVVDDNVDAAVSLAEILRLMGHEVCVAHDGQAALDMVTTMQPHVVLLDLGMPGMDGYQIARQLRERFEIQPWKLIALTGYGQAEDRERTRASGFSAHLVKPVDLATLQRLLVG